MKREKEKKKIQNLMLFILPSVHICLIFLKDHFSENKIIFSNSLTLYFEQWHLLVWDSISRAPSQKTWNCVDPTSEGSGLVLDFCAVINTPRKTGSCSCLSHQTRCCHWVAGFRCAVLGGEETDAGHFKNMSKATEKLQ